MSQKVTITRQRVVEEKAEAVIAAADPEDAVAVARHLIDGEQLGWQYSRTLETSEEVVRVNEVKPELK